MTDTAAIIAASCAIATIIGGLAAWSLRMTVKPLSVVIENNTKAMDRVTEILDTHGAKLEDHGTRITRIETVHEMEGF
jgi:hypothetical protein